MKQPCAGRDKRAAKGVWVG